MNLTPAIAAFLSGGMQGYQAGTANNAARAKADLEASQTKLANMKTQKELGDSGYRVNKDSGELEIDPSFLAGEQPIQKPGALPDPNAPPPVENGSYRRAKIAEQLRAMGNRGAVQNPLTLRAVHAIRHPGENLPAALEPYGETPYDPKYDNLFTQGQAKPGDVMANDAARKDYAQRMGMPYEATEGLSVKDLNSGTRYVRGQEMAGGRTDAVIKGANKRSDTAIAAENARNDAALKLREKLAADARAEKNRTHGGQQEAEKAYQKDWAEYVPGGGQARAKSNLSSLDVLSQKLRSHDTGITGRIAGFMGKGAVNLADPELSKMQKEYGDIVSNTLKEAFGSRPTNLDFAKKLEFSYDPQLSPKDNADLLDAFKQKMQAKIASRDAAANYYGQNKEIAGFTGGIDGLPNEEPAAPALNASQKRAAYAQKPDTRANGDQAGSAKKLGIAPGIVEAISDPSQIVSKEYSKSRDKTRIKLKNGKSVVVSGDQR